MTDCKTCSKCGAVKALSEFHRFRRSKDGRKPRCKTCNIRDANSYAAERKSASTRKKLEWYRRQPEEYRRARERKWNAKRGATLPDSYVASCVARTDFSASIVPKEMIDMKREQLFLWRLTNELKQEITNQQEKSNGN